MLSTRARRAARSSRSGFAGLVELDRHRIADGEKGEPVAAGADHAAGQADDLIDVLAQADAAAERELQRLVGDHFIMRLPQRTPRDERHPIAAVLRPRKPLHHHAQRPAVVFALDGVGDEAPRLRHAGHGPHAVFEIGGNAGDFRERAAGAALHDPQVRTHTIHQQRGLVDESAINAAHAHDDHEQQPDAHAGEGEAARIVADVADGEIHGSLMRWPSVSAAF